jgi:hypothetical protein
MKTLHFVLGSLVLAGTAFGFDGATIRVEPESLPKALYRAEPGKPEVAVDARVEASAIEPIGDGKFVLVAHDKASELYLVETATGRIIGPPVTSEALPATSAAGPKWEAMARDAQGNYYAMGSHSGKDDSEKSQRSHLVRFRFKAEPAPGEAPVVDPASVVKFDAAGGLATALGLDKGDVAKLKVEGLAVRQLGGKTEVVVGLREPSDLVRVFAAEIQDSQGPGSPLNFQRLFAFDAGKRDGVPAALTSLEYLPNLGGFAILTATEDSDNAFHGNTLWFLPNAAIPRTGLARPERCLDFEVAMKAEGLAELPTSGPKNVARLVVAFDNDAKTTHMPSRIQVLRLTRRSTDLDD